MRSTTEDGWTVIQDEIFVGVPKTPGADNNASGVQFNQTRHINCRFIANRASEAFKASNKTDLEFFNCYFERGVEDGADFGDCHSVLFDGCEFAGNDGPQDITAKHGCTDFKFKECKGLRKVVLGNYTIYDGRAYKNRWQLWPSTPKTKDFDFADCGTPDVESMWAEKATGDCKPTVWPAVCIAAFFYVRFWFFPEKGQNALTPPKTQTS